jgi:hypothetical protein
MKAPRRSIVPRKALVLLAAVALVALAGCATDKTPPNAPSQSAASRQLVPALHAARVDAQALAHARDVKARYWARLQHDPDIVGMGIAWNDAGAVFIGVVVDRDHAGSMAKVQSIVEGIPVRVQLAERPIPFAPKPPPPPPTPILMGTSSGNDNYCGAGGTVGCVVAAGNTKYFLSCAHVYTPNNDADLSAKVTDPMRRLPNCLAQPVIGTVSDFTPMVDGGVYTMDAAIAKVGSKVSYSTEMFTGYTPTSTVTPPSEGLLIKKTGAATAVRSGVVSMIDYDTALGGHGFTGQMFIDTDDFALPGDSGALAVTEAENNPVGIVIGGGPGSYTIVTPIQRILDRFGVTVAP